jgi:hypothetical protein
VIRAAQRALDGFLGRPFAHLTSLDPSNAFNTVDQRDIASGLRRFAPSLCRAGKWAYGTSSDLILVAGYGPARDAPISTTTRATLMLPASHSSTEQ